MFLLICFEQLKGRNFSAGETFAEIIFDSFKKFYLDCGQKQFPKVNCVQNFSIIQLIRTKKKFQPCPQGFGSAWLSFVKLIEERLWEPHYKFLKAKAFFLLSSLHAWACNCHILEKWRFTFHLLCIFGSTILTENTFFA